MIRRMRLDFTSLVFAFMWVKRGPEHKERKMIEENWSQITKESVFIGENGILQFEKYYIGPIGSINNYNINLMFFWSCIMNWLYINYQLDALIIIYS